MQSFRFWSIQRLFGVTQLLEETAHPHHLLIYCRLLPLTSESLSNLRSIVDSTSKHRLPTQCRSWIVFPFIIEYDQ